MSITSSRPEDQPNQRRAAAGGQHLLAVHGLPDGRGRERDDLLDALVLRDAQRVLDHPAQALLSGRGQRGAVELGGEIEVDLVRERGHRPRSPVGVHHEQVHRVRSNVEDA
jgi:hypothetical protein